MMTPHRRGTTRQLAAVVAAALLALVGLLVPASVGAADPTWNTTIDVTTASAADGLTVEVEGTGYAGLPPASTGAPAVGVYVGLRNPADSYADIAADNSLLLGVDFLFGAGTMRPNWNATIHVDAADLDPAVDYDVIIWTAHGELQPNTVVDTVPLGLTDVQRQNLFPGWTPPTSTTSSTTTTTTTPPSTHPWSTTATVTQASQKDGLSVEVAGTGYRNLPATSTGGTAVGVYVGLRDPADSLAAISLDNDLVLGIQFLFGAGTQQPNWTTTLQVDAGEMDPDVHYEVIVWAAHGNPTDQTVLDQIPLNLTSAEHEALFPGGRPPATTTPSTVPRPTTTEPTSPTTTAPATQRHTTVDETGLRCVTETTAGTVGTPQLHWGVRSSFVSYIEGGVAKGSIETSGGVTRSGNGFTWPNGSGEVNEQGQGTWSFPGAVHFSGHKGVLNTTLSNLRIQVNGSTGSLIADVQSQDMEGNDVSGSDMTVAELHFASVSPSGGTASATLTAAGARALNSMYEPGTALDPVTVSTSGGTAGSTVENCYDAAGNLVSSTPIGGSTGPGGLAATGFGAWRLAATGVIMLVLGMLALTVTTRRRRVHLTVD